MADKFWSKVWFPGGWFVWEEAIDVMEAVSCVHDNSYIVLPYSLRTNSLNVLWYYYVLYLLYTVSTYGTIRYLT
jgi:hypothetical protein